MTVHISECVLGVFAFDDEGRILVSKDFPHDVAEVSKKIADIRTGIPTDEHRELIIELMERGYRGFTLESKSLVSKLGKEFEQAKFGTLIPNKAGEILRTRLRQIAEQIGREEVDKLVREVNLILTRQKLRAEIAKRDKLLIQAIDVLDEIDKFVNIFSNMVREWYSTHFPEFNRLVPEHEVYLKLVLKLGSREKFTKTAIEKIARLSSENSKRIAEASKSSLGAPLDEPDIAMLQDCAQKVLELYELREGIAEYINGLMIQIAPNLREMVGSLIGARLISLAGGLEKLSRLPASTLQVLGAEKALFRALRTHGKPPKHGVIYQYPEIRGAPKRQRGKIARMLAGKLAIAARVDALSGEFVGDKLAADFKMRITQMKTK